MKRTRATLPMMSALLASLIVASGPADARAQPGAVCTTTQANQAKGALGEAKTAMDLAISAIDNPKPKDLDRLKTWLGVVNSVQAAEVRKTLVASRAFSDGVSFRCDLSAANTYAYVNPDKAFLIVLGPVFFSTSSSGLVAKFGTIVHEISHFTLTGATQDPATQDDYGPDKAKALALQDPAAARRNAENIEYFVSSTVAGL